MEVALARHDAVLHEAITARRGVVFSTAGDAFAAAFWTPQEAVEAAVAAQAALVTETGAGLVALQVRMGIHTGTASERDGDYFGPTVNRAARIMAAAHGTQVLVSDATARLVRDVGLRDLGEHRLKDIDEPERLWQVGDRSYPPLLIHRHRIGNLPAASQSFVGRVDECKRLMADLQPGRVLTLTGVGGVGKTRLALEVAHTLSSDYADGAWWCDLTPIDDPAGCALAVASTMSAVPQARMDATEAVVNTLFGRRALLVFDNCEHVLDAAAGLIAAIAASCPTVATLATSREPLAISAEHVWPLRPLNPDLEGVELFLERASAADATFSLGDERPTLVELCRSLDGIPLAIELAAAQVRSMTPSELFVRLDDRLRLLHRHARDGVARHRTLAATLDWSYTLLEPVEQALFDRLSVFAGTFDLTAVEAICIGDPVDAPNAVGLLANLVDKSLVTPERTAAGMRYRLLETVRQYAAGHAAERGETSELSERHLGYFAALAETASPVGALMQRERRPWSHARNSSRGSPGAPRSIATSSCAMSSSDAAPPGSSTPGTSEFRRL
jgi:predicted ATPase